jgi:O-antigen biosynthesis protein WbqP
MRKRFFDIFLSLFLILLFACPFLLLLLVIQLTSKESAIYWSSRVGRNNHIFQMPKLRSMRADTPVVATHLIQNVEQWYTPLGKFLRLSSLDELPQLFSILKGDMSFVGPRPALYNQYDLINLRTEAGVQDLRPGLTGWAQVNGRDAISLAEKVRLDFEYLKRISFSFDLYILALSINLVVKRKDVTH